jgi:hypothetical protein
MSKVVHHIKINPMNISVAKVERCIENGFGKTGSCIESK